VILGSIGGFFGSMFLFLATIAAISGFQNMIEFFRRDNNKRNGPEID
jgi:hypothetical protein